jgi:hypothetical protein
MPCFANALEIIEGKFEVELCYRIIVPDVLKSADSSPKRDVEKLL